MAWILKFLTWQLYNFTVHIWGDSVRWWELGRLGWCDTTVSLTASFSLHFLNIRLMTCWICQTLPSMKSQISWHPTVIEYWITYQHRAVLKVLSCQIGTGKIIPFPSFCRDIKLMFAWTPTPKHWECMFSCTWQMFVLKSYVPQCGLQAEMVGAGDIDVCVQMRVLCS